MGGTRITAMSAEAQSADADTDTDEGWDIYPQATQHPHTIVAGDEIVDINVNRQRGQEDTDHSVGVVFKNPTVYGGTLWRNREIPDGFDSAAEFNATLRTATTEVEEYANGVEVTEEAQEEAREAIAEALDDDIDFEDGEAYPDHRLSVDYKVADPDDRAFEEQSVDDTTLGISVGAKTFPSSEVEEFEEDHVMVWYRGIVAQFVINALDFNGVPSARWKEDSGYLVKGIHQHPMGWFERDGENYPDHIPDEVSEAGYSARSTLASERSGLGRPPRVVRPAVLREDIEGDGVFIDIDRYQGGDSLSVTLGFNEGDWDIEEYMEAKAEAQDSDDSVFDILDGLEGPQPRYEDEPEAILVDAFDLDDEEDIEYLYDMYEGDGWQPKPDSAVWGTTTDSGGSEGGSFDMPDGTSDDAVEHPTDQERDFAEQLAEVLTGTGATPDDDNAFEMGGETMNLEAVVGHNADQFDVTPDVDSIRTIIYENVAHLDAEDLDE